MVCMDFRMNFINLRLEWFRVHTGGMLLLQDQMCLRLESKIHTAR